MAGVYERYRQVDYKLPESYLSWELYGAGLENLGRDGKAVELPLTDPRPDQVLLRVDALGLCFSDTKLIWPAPNHPSILGRDLMKDPTVAGHEAAMTVVKVGTDWKNKFSVGQRFIIQADIKIGGEQKAFGYVQRGAMAQYAYAGPWVLDGEGTCYLLPIKDETGYAEAALVEPWACVEAAYHQPERLQPVAGGKVLVVCADAETAADFTGAFPTPPTTLVVLGAPCSDVNALMEVTKTGADATPEAVRDAAATAGGFDDIYLIGVPEPALIEACDLALAPGGVLCFLSASAIPAKAALDIGRTHYELTRCIGSAVPLVRNAYGQNVRQELQGGGRAWMIGAAGPMGQMHVQRALELPRPPAVLFCTDLSDERMNYMKSRLQPIADKKGVKLICLNVGGVTDLGKRIGELTNNAGFDDVYVHAPVPALVEQGADYLGDHSVLNIFAGVGIGTKAKLSPEIFRKLHTRMIGSSGSSMEDIVNTLAKLESGQLATRISLAALGGIEATWLGIKGVKENRFPGKTVIFPQVNNLDLIGLDGFASVCPEAAAQLGQGCVWTNEAERTFIDRAVEL
ncbi:MAG: alcohol dehydrogenase catalytic domain-containing protein [Planctomycetaceae bacterium]|nr:alcohol dehydrogenase catalytic domain-containing protein [Planctomycetaceae bacterium]